MKILQTVSVGPCVVNSNINHAWQKYLPSSESPTEISGATGATLTLPLSSLKVPLIITYFILFQEPVIDEHGIDWGTDGITAIDVSIDLSFMIMVSHALILFTPKSPKAEQ